MKILLHTCCAPCSIYPLKVLRQYNHDVMGFFYRHNIHPYTECMKREDALKSFSDQQDFRVIYQEDYAPEVFLQNTVFRESSRCLYCYHARLTATVLLAKRGKFDAFTTTLLYSKHQNHARITEIGHALAKQYGVSFFYEDFRQGWKEGIDASKKADLYRQQYCGCIYSEKERYLGKK